jgi:hypothetical protein
MRREAKDWPGALESLGEAVEHGEKVFRATGFQGGLQTLAFAYAELGETHEQAGTGEGCPEYRRALEAYRRLPNSFGDWAAASSHVEEKVAACRTTGSSQ